MPSCWQSAPRIRTPANYTLISFLLRERPKKLEEPSTIPARKDVEPDRRALYADTKRIVFQPAKREEYAENDKMYKEIFGILELGFRS